MSSEPNIGQPPSAGGGEAPAVSPEANLRFDGSGRGLPAPQAARAKLVRASMIVIVLAAILIPVADVTGWHWLANVWGPVVFLALLPLFVVFIGGPILNFVFELRENSELGSPWKKND